MHFLHICNCNTLRPGARASHRRCVNESRALREYEATRRPDGAHYCALCGNPQPVPSLARDCENRHLDEDGNLEGSNVGADVAP